jgi:hypothetical protein
MNLFRSEEHARNWKGFKENTEAGIVPLKSLAKVFSIKLFTRRLDPDYVTKIGDYIQEFVKTVSGMGPFWQMGA